MLFKDLEWVALMTFPLFLWVAWMFLAATPQDLYKDQLQRVIFDSALVLTPVSVLGLWWRYRRAATLARRGSFVVGRVVGFTMIARANYAIYEYDVGGEIFSKKEPLFGSRTMENAKEVMMQELAVFADMDNPNHSVLMTKLP